MKEIDQALLKKVIIERSRSSHKGDYGRLLLIGGTYPYGGAIIMAALGAVRSGAGLVTVATDKENIPALHSHLPEAMAFDLDDKQLLEHQLDKANVSFFIDENLLGTQTVVLKITKNGMNLTNSDVMKYYSTLGEKVQYEEEGSKVKITFLKEFQCDKEESELKRIKSLSLHKLKYELNTSLTLNSYFPVDTEKVTYTVSLPNSLKVEHFSFGNEVLNKKEIKAGKDKQQWTYQVQLEGAQEVTINLDFAKPNFIFYGIMSIVVLLLIGGGLSVYFYFIRDYVTRRKRPIG